MASIDQAVMVLVGLIIAFSLVAMGRNFVISIQTSRNESANTEAQLRQIIMDCWGKAPIQDCSVVELNMTVEPFDPGIPVEWRASSGTVKISRERDKIVVAPF